MKKIIFLVGVLCNTFTSSSQVVTTFAGSGIAGYADGSGATAKFTAPLAVCTDVAGNLYVADTGNQRIRKITQAGVVSTFAGSGIAGYVDGTGIAACFNNPCGVCIDASGNLYVADTGNQRIRKITPTGDVTTFAGSGVYGFADGTGTAARFYNPTGVCINATGNLYIADRYNQRIRKITSTGVVTTLAGSGNAGLVNGTGTAAWFNSPMGVCTDSAGNIYVADSFNNGIRKITPSGVVTIFAGATDFSNGSIDGIGTAAKFFFPTAVCVDVAGNIYVADHNNNRVRKITPTGVVTTFAGSTAGYVDGTGISAKFSGPYGICIDAIGNLYLTDSGNNNIRQITTTLGVTPNTISNDNVMIYPNPTKDKFTIGFGNQIIHSYTIKINNLLGQEVYSTTTIDKPQVEVFNTWQGKGLYFVRIYDEHNSLLMTKKIILQ